MTNIYVCMYVSSNVFLFKSVSIQPNKMSYNIHAQTHTQGWRVYCYCTFTKLCFLGVFFKQKFVSFRKIDEKKEMIRNLKLSLKKLEEWQKKIFNFSLNHCQNIDSDFAIIGISGHIWKKFGSVASEY